MRESGVPTPIRSERGGKALEGSPEAEEVHAVRGSVHAEARARDDMLPELRQQARLEQAMMYRADRLRCVGNGVVAAQAAAALIALVWRMNA